MLLVMINGDTDLKRTCAGTGPWVQGVYRNNGDILPWIIEDARILGLLFCHHQLEVT